MLRAQISKTKDMPPRRTWVDSDGVHHLESSSLHGNARVSVQLSLGSIGIFNIIHNNQQPLNAKKSSDDDLRAVQSTTRSPSGKHGIQLRLNTGRRRPTNLQSSRSDEAGTGTRRQATQNQQRNHLRSEQTVTQDAEKLFCVYDKAWRSLPPGWPDIPFPSIDFSAASLRSRDLLVVPCGVPPISNWATEVVVQANVQAFMLGGVGMSPHYTFNARTRQLHTGFDNRRTPAEQIVQLVAILKRERVRWHPDQLNRRFVGEDNGADALARSEDAKAVYLAVCDLLDLALQVERRSTRS